ncbi:MAG: PhoX family phosphatase [Rhodospirillales bacterium]|nr:PhoX family phosphatase [Rhodospirillales bacterium]
MNDRTRSSGRDADAADEGLPAQTPAVPTLGDVIALRLGRREMLMGSLAVTAIGAAGGLLSWVAPAAGAAASRFKFREIAHGVDETHHVAPGHDARILIRWGDPVVSGAPPFDPMNQSAAAQSQQFGYNNDYIGYLGLPFGSANTARGVLCVNHEYTSEEVMFPSGDFYGRGDLDSATRERVDVEMAAHGTSVLEVQRDETGWRVVGDGDLNRRITALATEFELSGPAAGDARVRTLADPSGLRVIGTINNCAGGMTPWGTYLSCEENFHTYFWGTLAEDHPEHANYKRYGLGKPGYAWGRFHDRFDINKEPNEANRFGWIVEIDPLDPASTPRKRTALGRFKHEGAETIVNTDGRVVIYSGDDQRFEYLYRFVSDGIFDAADRAANMDLLDRGTLSVARFLDDGRIEWLPLVHGENGLTAENGFASQADVLIETRRAADVLGATPMDRPEDVEADPASGKVFVLLTNNSKREPEQTDAANPRAENRFGHIIEIAPAGGNHAATGGTWEILVLCGDPAKPEVGARWNAATSENGWFASPDNCAVDPQGRLWVATDQGSSWAKTGTADGVWGLETEGELRGTGKMFFRVPIGAEMCGPQFTADGRTLFVAVQHPATDGTEDYPGFERKSTFEDPATRWPDFKDDMPPRPSVVVITKNDGGMVGE